MENNSSSINQLKRNQQQTITANYQMIKKLKTKLSSTHHHHQIQFNPSSFQRIRINSLPNTQQYYHQHPPSKLISSNQLNHHPRSRSSSEPPPLLTTPSIHPFNNNKNNSSSQNLPLNPLPPTQTHSTHNPLPRLITPPSKDKLNQSCHLKPIPTDPPANPLPKEHRLPTHPSLHHLQLSHHPSTPPSLDSQLHPITQHASQTHSSKPITPSPKSNKSPSRLSRILQPSVRVKEPDEQIPTDQPLVIQVIYSHDKNQTKSPTVSENDAPKPTRLSKRLQAMKAASALIKFNSPSNPTTSSLPKTPFSQQLSSTNEPTCSTDPSKPNIVQVTQLHNKFRARREPTKHDPASSKSKHLSTHHSINRTSHTKISNMVEQSETVKLSKLTARQTNLNRKRLSIIKVEDVVMRSLRPPSPEAKFRKKNLAHLSKTSGNRKKKQPVEPEDENDDIEEIRISLLPTPSAELTNTHAPYRTDQLAANPPAPNSISDELNCSETSLDNIHGQRVSVRMKKIKKKVMWNQENLAIDPEEQYQRLQNQQVKSTPQKGTRTPPKFGLLISRNKVQDDKNGEETLIERSETPIDPFLNLGSRTTSSSPINYPPSSRSTPLSVSSSPSISCARLKPILKINFRNSQDRQRSRGFKDNSLNHNLREGELDPVKEGEKSEERQYQYELDDFGNILSSTDNDNLNFDSSSSNNPLIASYDDPLKSLNLKPIFVKVSRRIWLD